MRKANELAQEKVAGQVRGDEQFAQKLRELRESNSLNPNQVARETGISVQSINKYEKNEGLPGVRGLATLAAFYDVTLDDLAGHLIR